MKTKGAYSYLKVNLSDLNARLSAGATVIVSRKWAEANGLQGESALSTVLSPIVSTKVATPSVLVAAIPTPVPATVALAPSPVVAAPVASAPEVAPVIEIL